MIKKWNVAALAVLVAVSIASPALAQSAWPIRGSRAYGAFDTIPHSHGGPYNPAANGGGSAGYNWMLENDR
jgi:hypothetical protein